MMNQVHLVGRLGKDVELRYTHGGKAVANFSLATDHSYFSQAKNERVTETEWHRIVVWGKRPSSPKDISKKGVGLS